MFHRAAPAMMMLMILGTGVETAPTERDPLAKLSRRAAVPEKSSALNLSPYLKQWLVSTRAAALDGTTKTTTGTLPASTRAGRWKSSPEAAGTGKTAHMLKMISALEELHRTLNSTLSSRITLMPRGLKPTTAPPADSTASRASSDAVGPGLTGRNFRKSLPPQNKKTNKRVNLVLPSSEK
ncbi:unnamed protein product [Pleuronectes platessa]|uniref:Uncharacterized protein n=1 Tax=Pleuronectes platessa TaxID=8262 RepID=A0A9N7TVB9_PLEPL|nr:unnamed protein product [Pleuronectes platessa]